MMRLRSRTALVWMIAGFAIIFLSLLLETGFFSVEGTGAAEHHTVGVQIGLNVLHSVIKLLDVAGIALVVLGLIHIVIEAEGWSEYFRERLREIVLEESYLKTLDESRLNTLHASILKVQFGDQQIDRDGSFFNYLRSNLHSYISSPYREDVTAEVIYTDAGDFWETFDCVTYVCRRATRFIQPIVSWRVDPDEYVNIEYLKIEIQYPFTHPDRGKKETLYSDKPDLGKSLAISLEKYREIDRLIVIATGQYRIRKNRIQYWSMTNPTKNFSLTLTFPSDHMVQMKPLVLSPDLILATTADGYYKAKYDFWMLPESGMAWTILPKGHSDKVEHPTQPEQQTGAASAPASRDA
jgi:hypothetical protein